MLLEGGFRQRLEELGFRKWCKRADFASEWKDLVAEAVLNGIISPVTGGNGTLRWVLAGLFRQSLAIYGR